MGVGMELQFSDQWASAPVRAFQRYDSQGAKALSRRDMQAVLDTANFEASPDYLEKMFSLWDKDGSGTVEQQEFVEIWHHLELDSVAELLVAPGSGAAKIDPVVAAFDRFNRNGDGMLDMEEVRLMMENANYSVDAPYVVGLADMFGTYDEDGSGGIELPEFRIMWAQLNLAQLLAGSSAQSGAEPGFPPPHQMPTDEVAAAFAKYNRNGDGMLDLQEIDALLEDAKFDVDASYVNGLAGMFGKWDADGSGGIELAEFRELWAQLDLGGMLRAAKAAAAAAPAGANYPIASQPAGDAVAAAFAKYNRNGDGLLDLEELRVLLDDAHFEFDASYVNGIADM